MNTSISSSLARAFACAFLLYIALPHAARAEDIEAQNPGEVPEASLQIVRNARAVYVYRYEENMGDIDPHADFTSARRVTEAAAIQELRRLLSENAAYSPQFTARCLPSWDYGLEFRESDASRVTFLFSFRCKQMMIYERKVYRDFTPQSVKFHALFSFELDEDTTVPLPVL